jgi:hypothetical protein
VRLLSQIKRILEINSIQTITKEVVEAARENLVIGTVQWCRLTDKISAISMEN